MTTADLIQLALTDAALVEQYYGDNPQGIGTLPLDLALHCRALVAEVERLEAERDAFEQRQRDTELRGAQHGANQARREVVEYLRSIGQPVTAMAIDARCRWPDED